MTIPNITPFDEVVLKIDGLYTEARNWADGTPITSDEQHDAVTVLYEALHEAGKEADALRVEEVKPLDDAKAVIQKRYHPLIGDTKAGKGRVVMGKEALNAVLSAWRVQKQHEQDEAAKKARREADEERRKAEAAIRASSGDLEARERAEEQLALAKDAEKFAERQRKAATTGTGLRSNWTATLTDLSAAIQHYWAKDRAAFEALVQELADRDVRKGVRGIPGFEINNEKKAI